MISSCANPQCAVPFHYLRGGRLYRFELRSPCEPCADVPNAICSQKPSRATVYFWLCEHCCVKFSAKFHERDGLRLLPAARAGRNVGSGPVVVESTDTAHAKEEQL